jgi:hypothetical protein
VLGKSEQSSGMTSLGFSNKFDINVSSAIATYLVPKQYKFLDWIPIEKLESWRLLSYWLPQSMLEKYFHYIDNENEYCWDAFFKNPEAISLIERQLESTDKLHSKKEWDKSYLKIVENPNATSHLLSVLDKVPGTESYFWSMASAKSNSISFLERNLKKLIIPLVCYNKNSNVHNVLELYGINTLTSVCWSYLSENKSAISFLEKFTKNFTTNLDKIDWNTLSKNENAIHILSRPEFQDKINLIYLVTNENGVEILKKHLFEMQIEDINIEIWRVLSRKPYGIPILEKLTKNFTQHLDKIDWYYLSANENAIPIIKQFLDLCHMDWLCQNRNATQLIEEILLTNPEKITSDCWSWLCKNPNAFHLFNKYQHLIGNHINWSSICLNESIIEFDNKQYNKLKNKYTHCIYNL